MALQTIAKHMKLTAYPTLLAACNYLRRNKIFHLLCILLCVSIMGCASHPRYRDKPITDKPKTTKPSKPSRTVAPSPKYRSSQIGYTSYYAHKFHGRPTASGEIYDMNGLSAAHRELPLGTNGKSVVVKVNDRGPFVDGRILDLSLGAAKKLDMVNEGVARVKIEIVKSVN
ncbi:MAG: septal ring lytic transglycosylase RlpA family protein [Candidatus Latescibacteria bacterium]|nr:septal ring lytic transglycosylase RlpA family protein [Candidatus Latescibacterota bacterium]